MIGGWLVGGGRGPKEIKGGNRASRSFSLFFLCRIASYRVISYRVVSYCIVSCRIASSRTQIARGKSLRDNGSPSSFTEASSKHGAALLLRRLFQIDCLLIDMLVLLCVCLRLSCIRHAYMPHSYPCIRLSSSTMGGGRSKSTRKFILHASHICYSILFNPIPILFDSIQFDLIFSRESQRPKHFLGPFCFVLCCFVFVYFTSGQ